jgi:hypothetical protein
VAQATWAKISGVHHQPDGPAFDVVLLLHVGCVVVAMVTLVAGIATASRLRAVLLASAPFPEAVNRYFRPGVNWAGRSLYGVPVFGFVLLALSGGAYSLRDGWVVAGLIIIVAAVLVVEYALWPAERRLQVSLVPFVGGGSSAGEAVLRDARTMVLSAAVALLLLVGGSVLMVAQP